MQRVLHVEDDPLVARSLKRLLRLHGYFTTTAHSDAEARALRDHFDAAVIDIDLGDGDGIVLAEHLLEQGVVDQVVFFTGRNDAAAMTPAQRLGRVLVKTSGMDAVLDAVADALAQARCVPTESQQFPTAERESEDETPKPKSSERTA